MKIKIIALTMAITGISALSVFQVGAGVNAIRDNQANHSVDQLETLSPPSNDQIVTESLTNSTNELQQEISSTSSAINDNIRESDKNTNQLNNAATRISILNTTRADHHKRITDLENRPPPLPPIGTWVRTGSGGRGSGQNCNRTPTHTCRVGDKYTGASFRYYYPGPVAACDASYHECR